MRHSDKTSLRSAPAAAAVCLICCLLTPAPGRGIPQVRPESSQPPVGPGYGQRPRPNASTDESAQKERQVVRTPIPDLDLIDQNGRKINFYTDLVKGKVVVINFVFTTCTAICPMMGRTFSGLQNLAGDRAGKDFHLVSVTTDPENDTPTRLRAWGAKFGAKPDWTLVTGEKSEIDKLLRALIGESVGTGVHTPIVLIGNDAKGTWTSASGLTAPSNLMKIIDEVMND
jgi:protein SCO1